MSSKRQESARPAALSAQDLLAGGDLVHEVAVPEAVLRPRADAEPDGSVAGYVRLRPLSVGTLALISRAAREDARLVPLLMIKESVVEPAVSLEQARQMHVGLVQFLVADWRIEVTYVYLAWALGIVVSFLWRRPTAPRIFARLVRESRRRRPAS